MTRACPARTAPPERRTSPISGDEPYLKLVGDLARNENDAIEQHEVMKDLPDAIALDDYLSEGGTTAGRALEIMAWLCRRCIEGEMPLRDRPLDAWYGRFSAGAPRP